MPGKISHAEWLAGVKDDEQRGLDRMAGATVDRAQVVGDWVEITLSGSERFEQMVTYFPRTHHLLRPHLKKVEAP